MILQLIKGNLFDTTDKCIAHCVSADFKLGAGIAKVVKEKYPKLPNIVGRVGVSYPMQNDDVLVFHLVTKEKYYGKPTYDTLRLALISMKEQLDDIKNVSIPKIGCGLDKLEWSRVRKIIEEVFDGVDVVISVYKL